MTVGIVIEIIYMMLSPLFKGTFVPPIKTVKNFYIGSTKKSKFLDWRDHFHDQIHSIYTAVIQSFVELKASVPVGFTRLAVFLQMIVFLYFFFTCMHF